MTEPVNVLTLCQPWATLVIAGAKRIETRSWPAPLDAYCPHGRPLAIAASKGLTADNLGTTRGGKAGLRELLGRNPTITEALRRRNYRIDDLAAACGHVLGIVTLRDCREMTDDWLDGFYADAPDDEAAFGDFAPGRYAWILVRPLRFHRPVPAPLEPGEDGRRRQGVWRAGHDLAGRIVSEEARTLA